MEHAPTTPEDEAKAQELCRALEDALRSDDADGLAKLIAKGAPLDVSFSRRETQPTQTVDAMRLKPLALAAHLGHPKCVKALLDAGVDVNENSPGFGDGHGGGAALMHAASSNSEAGAESKWSRALHAEAVAKKLLGKLACVDLLVKAGADVEGGAFGKFLSTPLMSAVGWSSDMMDLLIQHGARVDAVSDCGRTVLIAGVFEHSLDQSYAENLSWILARGARSIIDVQDSDGNSALSWAAAYSGEEALRVLLAAGASVDLANDKGERPLLRACGMNNVAHAQALVEAGAYTENPDEEGRTPLLIAAENKSELLSALLAKGADLSARTRDGQTGLHRACLAGIIENAEALLKAGAEVDARDGAGVTPLMVAAKSSGLEMVKLLVEKGADVAAVDGAGKSVWQHASSKDVSAMQFLRAMIDDLELNHAVREMISLRPNAKKSRL
jgi:ankyrin repeat protein